MLKKLLASAGLVVALATSAYAQVNTVPQTGLNTENLRHNTYTASSVGLVPASSATDIVCLQGSATKTIRVSRVFLGGTSGTTITTPVILYRRVLLDSGGTPASGIALPVPVPYDSTNPAATATLNAWTANPTINDSSPSLVGAASITFNVTTINAETDQIEFGTTAEAYDQPITIRGATQALCVNLNGVTVTSGVLTTSFEWTEY